MRKLTALFAALCVVTVLLSCSDDGKGKRGTFLDEGTMLLDGDTFHVQFIIDDSTLCVSPVQEDDPYWPMAIIRGRDGFYHTVSYEYTRPIYNTDYFVLVNDTIIYEWMTGKKYSVREPYFDLMYLGEWDNQLIFQTLVDWQYREGCTILFTDGREVTLRKDTHALPIEEDGTLTLTRGALSINVNPAELHDYHPTKEMLGRDTETVFEEYEETSICGYPKFGVDMDVPKGNTEMAKTIKKHLFRAVCNDIFWLLDYNPKQFYSISAIERGDIRSALEQVSKVWCSEVRKRFSDIDEEEYVQFYFPINVTEVAEGDDYATYYYETDALLGGAHDNPYSYYITYDKQRNIIVDANNTIKEGMMSAFKEKVPEWVNDRYEQWCHGGGLGDGYPCDEMGCCSTTQSGDLNFPLPHLSILPDGVVITFHPYQIGSFADGEFHVLIPKEDIKDCLEHNFWNNDSITRPLSYFVSKVEKRN